jgi:hypothetical protein
MGFLYILREKLFTKLSCLKHKRNWNSYVIYIYRERECVRERERERERIILASEWACTTDIEASKITSLTILVSRKRLKLE